MSNTHPTWTDSVMVDSGRKSSRINRTYKVDSEQVTSSGNRRWIFYVLAAVALLIVAARTLAS